jgi:hypothetical protein
MTTTILSVLLFLAPVVTESGKLTIRQNGRMVGTEEFSVRSQNKGYVVEGKTRLEGDPETLTSRMELDENLNPVSYEYTHGKGSMRIKVDPESSELTVVESGRSSTTNFRFPKGASIIDNNFFHHYLILLYRVKGTEASFPIFVPQDMQVGSAKVTPKGARTYALEVGDVDLQATVDENGRMLRLEVPSAKVVVER